MRAIFTVILATSAAALACADTLTLRNGTVIEGTYAGGNPNQVRIDVDGRVQTFEIGQVRSILFADESYSPAPPVTSRNDGPTPRYDGPPPPRNIDLNGLTIPSDTAITVRMIESVNSDTARLGQTFRASLDEPVYVDGRQVLPRGADVMTKLVDDRRSGKLQGRTVLTLALVSINIEGRPVEVTSSDVQTASEARGAKTAKVVGGTAALGAILGAIAGGGQGAAIGAASGAAVGGGAQVLTNGQQVKIPSETRLTFRLQAPVRL